MFVRQKKNKTGTVSVQVIDKSSGKYSEGSFGKVAQTIGSSREQNEIILFIEQAKSYIKKIRRQGEIDFLLGDDDHYYQSVYKNIQSEGSFGQVQLLGPELVLGKLFSEGSFGNTIGFNQIPDELFRHLVIARLVYPVSKLKTIDYLIKYKGIAYSKDEVYRYLDKLHKEQIQLVQQISFQHTVTVLDHVLSVVFYDVTTLYFEAENEDDFRITGFSKDGKYQQPQIVLGLSKGSFGLVSHGGYPLDYEIFEGNKFVRRILWKGHTMLPVVSEGSFGEAFKQKYKMQHLIVVADAGLMSDKNIKQLIGNKYEFIIGARIKNETEKIKQQILSLKLDDGASAELNKNNEQRLIVSYSTSRAKNDEHNRKRGLSKLETQLEKGKLTKKHMNNKGYNKYLKLEGEVTITIDYDKYNGDIKWDGLKGYVTNTGLSKEEVIDHYKQLWYIEKTFRISKTDLRIRPIYHYLKRRIEAHICIAFAACKIYKELVRRILWKRQLKIKKSDLSPEKVIDVLKTIYGITIELPQFQRILRTKQKKLMLLDKTNEQKLVLQLFENI